jgi:hypothetical protein
MADLPLPPPQGLDSLSMADSDLEYQREMIDISQLTVPAIFDTQEPPGITGENVEEGEDINEDANIETFPVPVPVANKSNKSNKRKRKRYSMQKIRARCELYLEPNKMVDLKILFPDSFHTIEIEGQVKECPRKERNFYRIQWNTDFLKRKCGKLG